MQMHEAGAWFTFRGRLTRRVQGKNKQGNPTYPADISVGSFSRYLGLTDVQWANIPPDGMDAEVTGMIGDYNGEPKFNVVQVSPFGQSNSPAATPVAAKRL